MIDETTITEKFQTAPRHDQELHPAAGGGVPRPALVGPGLGPSDVHSPKLHLVDWRILAHLLTATSAGSLPTTRTPGTLLERFVAMEVVQHRDRAQTDARIGKLLAGAWSTLRAGAM